MTTQSWRRRTTGRVAFGTDDGRGVECEEVGHRRSREIVRGQEGVGQRIASRRVAPDGRSVARNPRVRAAPDGIARTASARIHGRRRRPARATGRRRSNARAHTTAHSAHKVKPYETFSTLHPVTTRPSSTSAAHHRKPQARHTQSRLLPGCIAPHSNRHQAFGNPLVDGPTKKKPA